MVNKKWTEADFVTYQKNLEGKLEEYHIPRHMHEGVVQYIMRGRATGSFLHAVFSNNLMQATNRGDENNQKALAEYAKFIYNHAPTGCHGSEETVTQWKESGGLRARM